MPKERRTKKSSSSGEPKKKRHHRSKKSGDPEKKDEAEPVEVEESSSRADETGSAEADEATVSAQAEAKEADEKSEGEASEGEASDGEQSGEGKDESSASEGEKDAESDADEKAEASASSSDADPKADEPTEAPADDESDSEKSGAEDDAKSETDDDASGDAKAAPVGGSDAGSDAGSDDEKAKSASSSDDEGEAAASDSDSDSEDDGKDEDSSDEEVAAESEAAAKAVLEDLGQEDAEDNVALLRQKVRKQESMLIKPVAQKPTYKFTEWDDWEEDPENAVAWFAERECLVLLLEARIKLKEMILAKLKAERAAHGNLSIGEIRDLLNSQKEDAENDWIAEIQELKRNLVAEVRGNHVLERELARLEVRISLLIKNRGDITKDIGRSNARKAVATGSALLTGQGKLESYEQLFYLLQTEPSYLARLVFVMRTKDMNQFLDTVILTLYGANFSPREEFLILQLFQKAIEGEMATCRKIQDFLSSDSVVPKMLVTYIRREQGTAFLRKLVGPFIKDLLSRDLNLELKPVEVYKKMITEEETKSGKKSDRDRGLGEKQILKIDKVQVMIKERQETLRDICNSIVDRIFKDLKKVPYGIRWICKTIRALAEEQFPEAKEIEYLKIVAYFAYYRFINLSIVTPNAFDLIEDELEPMQIKDLATIGKVLTSLFNFNKFSSEVDKAYFCMNEWIEERLDQVVDYFSELIEVEEPEEYLRVDRYMELTQETKPVIMISTEEIILTHEHLENNLDKIAKDKHDPLRVILKELGAAPKGENYENREIQLTLTNKFKQELEEDVSASAALYAETKELVIQLLREVPLSEAVAAHGDGGEDLTLVDILDFARKWGKESGENSVVSEVKKINKNLASLEEEKFVNKADQYAGFLRDVALEVANRAEIREQQRKEIKRLTQTLRNLRKHHRYLEERIEHFELYLNECRQRHFQSKKKKGKKGKKQQVQSYTFKYKDLEKKQIINDSAVPKNLRGATKFVIGQNPDSFGSFDVTCTVAGKKAASLELELDELLERNYNNIATIDLDDVSLDVNLTIALINKLFVGK
jgi:Ras GTPase-activating-like protein IQGAP2/3